MKNPNKGEHVSYTLAELGMDPIKYSYGSRFQTYWEKEKNGEYQLLAVLPEKQVSKIEGLYYGVMGVGYFAILIGGICAFFIRRKRYTGWFLSFYYRLEKFYSEYGVWQKYSVERGYDTVDAIIAYGNENPIYFVNEFSNIHLTKEEVKKKKSKLAMVWLTSIAVMAGIILVISLYVNITSAIECRQNEARTAAVLEKLQNAIDEKTTGLGEKSEYYNYADMIDRARDTFPEEDIYYKLQTTEDYVTIIVTTKKKQNVCFRNTIHILAADRSDLFQRIDHTVYRRRSDTRILQRRLIINFLAAITFSFQNNIDQHEPLLRNPTATLFQLLDYSFFRVHDSPFPCCRLLGSDINYLKSCFLDSFFQIIIIDFSVIAYNCFFFFEIHLCRCTFDFVDCFRYTFHAMITVHTGNHHRLFTDCRMIQNLFFNLCLDQSRSTTTARAFPFKMFKRTL